MIELFVDRFEDCLYLGKITYPAGIRIDFTFDMQGYAEGVAVQAAAFVTLRHMGEAVGRFEDELFEQFHNTNSRRKLMIGRAVYQLADGTEFSRSEWLQALR